MKLHPIGEPGMLDVGEIERSGRRDGRFWPFLRYRDLARPCGFVSGRGGRGNRCRFFILAFALARFENQRQGRPGHPALHCGLNFARRQRGKDFELAGVEIRIGGQHFTRRQCDGLTAEPAYLLKPTDRLGDGRRCCAAHLVLCRALGNELCNEFIEPGFDHGRVDTRPRGCAHVQHADALPRIIAG